MTEEEFKKLFKLAVDKAFNPMCGYDKNNMKLKRRTEADIRRAHKEHKQGLITTEELLDMEWYYFENWVDPIQSHSRFAIEQGLDPIILN